MPLLPRLTAESVDFAVRGLRTDRPTARTWLERRARSFVEGFNLLRQDYRHPHPALATVEAADRGFAYEGAAMGAALLDLMSCGLARALRTLRSGPGHRYDHLVSVGVGWAMAKARVPSVRVWELDPLLRWLAHDGAGFSDTFFSAGAALERVGADPAPTEQLWLQGAGRALWFVEAAATEPIAQRIALCPPRHRPHLWSGVGLAATYAGAPGEEPLAGLSERAGEHVTHLQQGSAFAVTARLRHGVVPSAAERALADLTGLTPAVAAAWVEDASRDLVTPGAGAVDYLRWRHRVRQRLEEAGRPSVGPRTLAGGLR